MSTDPRRVQMIETLRSIIRTKYDIGRGVEPGKPVNLDCSRAVAYVCREVLRDVDWLYRFPSKDPMWTASAYEFWIALEDEEHAVQECAEEPADVIFYTRKPESDREPNPAYHVMLAVGGGGMIGACDIANEVCEYPNLRPYGYNHEAQVPDKQKPGFSKRGWNFKAIRRFPLNAEHRKSSMA